MTQNLGFLPPKKKKKKLYKICQGSTNKNIKNILIRVPRPGNLPGIWTSGFGVAGGSRPLASERLNK